MDISVFLYVFAFVLQHENYVVAAYGFMVPFMDFDEVVSLAGIVYMFYVVAVDDCGDAVIVV